MSVTKTGLAFFFVIHLSLIIRMPVSRYQIDDKILLLHIVTLVRAFATTTIMHHEIKKINQLDEPIYETLSVS